MKGEFVFIINGETKIFTDFRDIPDKFDHVIKFIPEIPDGPHTEEQHNEIDSWNKRFQEIMDKERARSN